MRIEFGTRRPLADTGHERLIIVESIPGTGIDHDEVDARSSRKPRREENPEPGNTGASTSCPWPPPPRSAWGAYGARVAVRPLRSAVSRTGEYCATRETIVFSGSGALAAARRRTRVALTARQRQSQGRCDRKIGPAHELSVRESSGSNIQEGVGHGRPLRVTEEIESPTSSYRVSPRRTRSTLRPWDRGL